MRTILTNFHIIDEETNTIGDLIIEDGKISEIQTGKQQINKEDRNAAIIIDGRSLSPFRELPVLMPAFVDLHAHFRDPGLPEGVPTSEVLESASLSAAAGGFSTVVCMANTKPAIDSIEKAGALKKRSDVLGLVDLYPVLSLSKNLEGKELSEIIEISPNESSYIPLMLSEDGKDLADDELFLAAMKEAKRIGIPVSCHCDLGGDENNAIRRVIELGKKAGCHIHIAHVSTREAVETIRLAKCEISAKTSANVKATADTGFTLTCEVMPHHLCLTEEDAKRLGEKTWGRVNPPLRPEADRNALVQALIDGTIDAIATDHAPHSKVDKEAGAPGFSGFETAFASVYTELVRGHNTGDSDKTSIIDLRRLSSLMSANPARFLGFGSDRGRILPGYRADLAIVDTEASWIVEPGNFKSRGKNSPFSGFRLFGKILMTLHKGQIVFGQ